jgi:hypothetical protein
MQYAKSMKEIEKVYRTKKKEEASHWAAPGAQPGNSPTPAEPAQPRAPFCFLFYFIFFALTGGTALSSPTPSRFLFPVTEPAVHAPLPPR